MNAFAQVGYYDCVPDTPVVDIDVTAVINIIVAAIVDVNNIYGPIVDTNIGVVVNG